MSGRTLRKLPFLAHALYIQVRWVTTATGTGVLKLLPPSACAFTHTHTPSGLQSSSTTLDNYLDGLEKATTQQFRDRENLAKIST